MNGQQERILSIYKVVDDICSKERIRHFAIGGTAIGAVRHQGFIPWDDDMDIAVPIEDFERFVSVAKSELPSELALVSSSDSAHYAHIFVKIADTKSTLIEPSSAAYPDCYSGAWLDVMPMSGVPSDLRRQRKYAMSLRLLSSLNHRGRRRYNSGKSIKDALLNAVARVGSGLRGIDCYSKLRMGLVRSQPFDEAEYVGFTWEDLSRFTFPREWFSDYVLMPFEDTKVHMPIGYHEYLTQHFGSYMQLPSPEGRVTHKCFVDLEHSYRDYQSGKLRIPEGYFDHVDEKG